MVMKFLQSERPPKIPPAPNFSAPFQLPPLRWGTTRILRCQLTNGGGRGGGEPPVPPSPPPSPPIKKTKAEPLQESTAISTPPPPAPDRSRIIVRLRVRCHEKEVPKRDRSPPPAPEAHWNLRSRAARLPESTATPDKKARLVESATPGNDSAMPLNLRFRVPESEEKRKRRTEKMEEFRLAITKEEVEEDFIAMTGSKPPRRPNRRPRAVQNQLDAVNPGFLLPKTIAPDRYRVPFSY